MADPTEARRRFFEIMRRHVHAEDQTLSDDQLVRAVLNRYLAARGLALIDPAE
jgi:hypothetical protein